MNKNTQIHKWHRVIPASLFIALEGLSAAPVIAGDGIVILQRDVPVRPAIREGHPGRAVTIDTSPNDKVQQAVSQSSSVMPTELDDAGFAAVTTGTSKSLAIAPDTSRLTDNGMTSLGFGSLGNGSSATSVTPMIAGAVGGAVGAATGQLNAGLTGTSNPMSGLTSAIMRTSGQ